MASPFGDDTLASKTPMAQQSPFGDEVWSGETKFVDDVKNLAPSALRTGVEAVPGGPGETSKLAPALVRKIIQVMVDKGMVDPQTIKDFEASYAPIGDLVPDMSTVKKYITDPILGEGEEVPAQTTGGGYVKTALEEAPSAITNPGSKWSKLAQWLGGSVGSESAGNLAEHYADQLPSWAPDAARFVGGAGGSMTPQAFNRASNPNPIPPFRQPHIDVLKAKNVPMTAGQITGSKKLLMKEDVAGAFPEDQMEKFGQAALQEQGGFPPGTQRAERKVMKAELDRMGSEFDRLEGISTVPFDQQLQDDLLDATIEYTENNPHVASVVEGTMNDLAKNAASNNGVITGEGFKNMRTRLNKLIGSDSTDPGVTGALMEMKDKLDEAIGRTLPTEEQSAWRKVRAQYRNYLPIERAKAAQGQGAAEGVINPKQLKMGVKAIEGKREIAAGDRPMTELAEAGEAVLERPGTSQTAERARQQLSQIITLLGGGAGATLGQILQSGPATAGLAGLGAAGAIGYPMIRDAIVRSEAGQRVLARQGPRIDTGSPTPVPDVRFPTGSPTTRQVGAPMAQVLMEMVRQAAMQAENSKKKPDEYEHR